jgi:EAL domain-containing protein (putative c-di-GMP-specific phosphodiesterase class I)
MGVALFPADATNAVDLLQAADIAMYEAKLMGKGQVVHYNVAMAEKYQVRLRMEQALQRAVVENEFLLYFQPRVAAVSGTLLSFEALLRWQHPQQGLVAPGSFIELAESSNLIVEIGDWVASQACVQMANWRALGLPSFHVSINVSARQLRTSQFRHHLATAMSTHGVLSSELAIELTESTMVGSDAAVLKELQLLRQMGIKLDIDDFGTGYSSLSQLQRLDVDAIKIDQSFVKALDGSGEGHALCDAMVKIGKALGIAVVAEGVETAEQLRQLQQMGCDEIQGYFISPPVPAEAVTALVRQLSFSEPYAPKLRLI